MGCGCIAVQPINTTPAPNPKQKHPTKLTPILSKPSKKHYHFMKILVIPAKIDDQSGTLDVTPVIERTVYDVTEEMEEMEEKNEVMPLEELKNTAGTSVRSTNFTEQKRKKRKDDKQKVKIR